MKREWLSGEMNSGNTLLLPGLDLMAKSFKSIMLY